MSHSMEWQRSPSDGRAQGLCTGFHQRWRWVGTLPEMDTGQPGDLDNLFLPEQLHSQHHMLYVGQLVCKIAEALDFNCPEACLWTVWGEILNMVSSLQNLEF